VTLLDAPDAPWSWSGTFRTSLPWPEIKILEPGYVFTLLASGTAWIPPLALAPNQLIASDSSTICMALREFEISNVEAGHLAVRCGLAFKVRTKVESPHGV
jgi:hypothetical protein